MGNVPQEPSDPDGDTLIGLAKWWFGERAALWGLIYLIVILGSCVAIAALLAPYLGGPASALTGAAVGGGAAAISRRIARRRNKDSGSSDGSTTD